MKLARILSCAAAAALAAINIAGGMKFSVKALSEYDIGTLKEKGQIKIIGRCDISGNMMSAPWSGCGFEMRVNAAGGKFAVNIVTSEEKVYFAVFVDGKPLDRGEPVTQQNTKLQFDLPAGEHTVKVVRDTQISKTGVLYILGMDFNGEVLEAPEEKDMYIEVVGDSIACGLGALGTYKQGEVWKQPEEDSAVSSFAYRTAEALDADLSIVARGGIGLYKVSSGSQEATESTKLSMQEVYPYKNGFTAADTEEDKYSFERKPDLILLELGANDDTKNESRWKEELTGFVQMLREKNGDTVPIVWVGKNEQHYNTALLAKRTDLKDDKNFYAFRYAYGGSGSAALATQTAGHPSAAEQQEFADKIVNFLKENNIDKPSENVENTGIGTAADSGKTGLQKSTLIKIGAAAGAVAAAAAVTGIIAAKRKKKNKKLPD